MGRKEKKLPVIRGKKRTKTGFSEQKESMHLCKKNLLGKPEPVRVRGGKVLTFQGDRLSDLIGNGRWRSSYFNFSDQRSEQSRCQGGKTTCRGCCYPAVSNERPKDHPGREEAKHLSAEEERSMAFAGVLRRGEYREKNRYFPNTGGGEE